VANLTVPFRDLTAGEDSGVAGYLRFIGEPDGKGIRGALFMVSSRGEPLDFSFTRIDVLSSFLWRAGESRRQAITSLTKALFQAATRAPTVILALADEVPPRVFTEDIEIGIPLCRVITSETAVQAASEEKERLSDSVDLFWVNGRPLPESPARSLIDALYGRHLLTEPFERASRGIQEVFNS
jgi:hypothetical protein